MASENTSTTARPSPRRGKKYFTVAEANRALPYVSRVVADVCRSYKTVVSLRHRLEHPRVEDDPDTLRHEYDAAVDQLNGLIEELHHVGVELKDFEMGLVDFPALHEDREVYLCWKSGEPAIKAWHEMDAGYTGRQPVATLEEAGE